jgi:hypothetical protein
LDPNIYTDGRIFVQGIDTVLFASDDAMATQTTDPNRKPPAIVTHKKKIKLRRGQYLPTFRSGLAPLCPTRTITDCSKVSHHRIVLFSIIASKFTARNI